MRIIKEEIVSPRVEPIFFFHNDVEQENAYYLDTSYHRSGGDKNSGWAQHIGELWRICLLNAEAKVLLLGTECVDGGGYRRFQQSISQITTVSGCERELNAHFYSAVSLKYHAPDT